MDTQIRPIWSTPVVVSPSARPILSLPARAAATPARRPSSQETTVQVLRLAILDCAAQAQTEEAHDTEARLHCFMAKLSGRMECMGEVDLDHALWDLMKLRAEPQRPYEVDSSATERIGGAPL
jgi:hypothetical protein